MQLSMWDARRPPQCAWSFVKIWHGHSRQAGEMAHEIRPSPSLAVACYAWFSRPRFRWEVHMPEKIENESSGNSTAAGPSHFSLCKRIVILAVCTVSALNVEIARADSINGTWCSPGGKRIVISYENVTLDDGNEVYGDYDRHHYVFKMPPDGEWAHKTADIVLGGEDVIYIRYISESGVELLPEPEKWTRCQADLS